MRMGWSIATCFLLVFLCALPSAGDTLEIHFSGLQVIASAASTAGRTTVDEVWVLSSAGPGSHPHRALLSLDCDEEGERCERVISVDGLDLHLLTGHPTGVRRSRDFQGDVIGFDSDLRYGRLSPGLLDAWAGLRDERLSSRLRLVNGTLDVDRARGRCVYSFEPPGKLPARGPHRPFAAAAVFSTAIPPEGISLRFVDRGTGETVGEIQFESDSTGAGPGSSARTVRLRYSNEPTHPPQDLRHYRALSALSERPIESPRVPAVRGRCPVLTTPSTGTCPPSRYP